MATVVLMLVVTRAEMKKTIDLEFLICESL